MQPRRRGDTEENAERRSYFISSLPRISPCLRVSAVAFIFVVVASAQFAKRNHADHARFRDGGVDEIELIVCRRAQLLDQKRVCPRAERRSETSRAGGNTWVASRGMRSLPTRFVAGPLFVAPVPK